MPRHTFPVGHGKLGGIKKGQKRVPQTVWVLEALKKRGYDYEKELVQALQEMKSSDPETAARALEMVDRLIKLAPHIANKPKDTVGMEGIEELVIERYKEPEKKPEAK